ncbi:PREDICTED: putative nuclease HARBI1 isoform X2 [Vollenhovia emeryi]|nr:PREDICTED: putative nuclease HARBI1 isoform X2 [Vollenhovia emeryi]XP_011858508.1 PREDICTED: putative nuclease HARBI1 isoform X2 [Vollenhovia emeryi]
MYVPSAKMKFFISVLWISFFISVRCQTITLNGVWTGTINICDVLSSSSSSSDEELWNDESRKIPKIENFIDVIHNLMDKEFKSHFRVSRTTAYKLIDAYSISQFYPSDRTHGGSEIISAELDVLSFLWFAGNKVCLRDVSQRFGVCPATTFRQNERVVNFLIDMAPIIIKFPENKEHSANEFLQIAGFPNVLGCIDGTSIKVITPAHKIRSTYVNRHDIPSITLQGICDARKRFIDVFTGVPAKIHDSRVLKLSDINENLPAICEGKYHLLGDAAYSIREWLLIPYRDYGNLTNKQREFNKRFCATRVLIENTFGLLKARFRQLTELHLHSIDKISKFIISCCVLHNLCIDNDDDINLEFEDVIDDNEELNDVVREEQEALLRRLGEIKRNALLEVLFP